MAGDPGICETQSRPAAGVQAAGEVDWKLPSTPPALPGAARWPCRSKRVLLDGRTEPGEGWACVSSRVGGSQAQRMHGVCLHERLIEDKTDSLKTCPLRVSIPCHAAVMHQPSSPLAAAVAAPLSVKITYTVWEGLQNYPHSFPVRDGGGHQCSVASFPPDGDCHPSLGEAASFWRPKRVLSTPC